MSDHSILIAALIGYAIYLNREMSREQSEAKKTLLAKTQQIQKVQTDLNRMLEEEAKNRESLLQKRQAMASELLNLEAAVTRTRNLGSNEDQIKRLDQSVQIQKSVVGDWQRQVDQYGAEIHRTGIRNQALDEVDGQIRAQESELKSVSGQINGVKASRPVSQANRDLLSSLQSQLIQEKGRLQSLKDRKVEVQSNLSSKKRDLQIDRQSIRDRLSLEKSKQFQVENQFKAEKLKGAEVNSDFQYRASGLKKLRDEIQKLDQDLTLLPKGTR